MSARFPFLVGVLLLAAAPAWAAGSATQPQATLQQQKMKNCNADASAKGLKGDARNSFMSQCLKGSTAGSAMNAAPTKEQTCMTQADDKKLAGAARTAFMKKCVGS